MAAIGVEIAHAIINLVEEDGIRDPKFNQIAKKMYGHHYHRVHDKIVSQNLKRAYPHLRETIGYHVIPVTSFYYEAMENGGITTEVERRKAIAGFGKGRGVGVYVPEDGGEHGLLGTHLRRKGTWFAGSASHAFNTMTDAVEGGGMSIAGVRAITKKSARDIRVKNSEMATALATAADIKALNPAPADSPVGKKLLYLIRDTYIDKPDDDEVLSITLASLNGKLTANKVERMLGKFVLAPTEMSGGRGYRVGQLRRAWERYAA